MTFLPTSRCNDKSFASLIFWLIFHIRISTSWWIQKLDRKKMYKNLSIFFFFLQIEKRLDNDTTHLKCISIWFRENKKNFTCNNKKNVSGFIKSSFTTTAEKKLVKRLEYSSFNSGNHLEVHMEKYVTPPILRKDFKLPANFLCWVRSTFRLISWAGSRCAVFGRPASRKLEVR